MTAFTRIAGESRTNLAVIDPTSGEQTEINDRGPEVSAEEVELFGCRVKLASLDVLERTKRATGRAKDLLDLEAIRRIKQGH